MGLSKYSFKYLNWGLYVSRSIVTLFISPVTRSNDDLSRV